MILKFIKNLLSFVVFIFAAGFIIMVSEIVFSYIILALTQFVDLDHSSLINLILRLVAVSIYTTLTYALGFYIKTQELYKNMDTMIIIASTYFAINLFLQLFPTLSYFGVAWVSWVPSLIAFYRWPKN